MRRCCRGLTIVEPQGFTDAHAVMCRDCDRVLAVVAGPRDEVYADL